MSCVSFLSRDGQGLPHAIMQTPCVYCAKDSKGFKPRLGTCTYNPEQDSQFNY